MTFEFTLKHRRQTIRVVYTIDRIECFGEPTRPMEAAIGNEIKQLMLAALKEAA